MASFLNVLPYHPHQYIARICDCSCGSYILPATWEEASGEDHCKEILSISKAMQRPVVRRTCNHRVSGAAAGQCILAAAL